MATNLVDLWSSIWTKCNTRKHFFFRLLIHLLIQKEINLQQLCLLHTIQNIILWLSLHHNLCLPKSQILIQKALFVIPSTGFLVSTDYLTKLIRCVLEGLPALATFMPIWPWDNFMSFRMTKTLGGVEGGDDEKLLFWFRLWRTLFSGIFEIYYNLVFF